MNWISVKDKAPPYDTLVLVRYLHPEYGYYMYATAFNHDFPPHTVLSYWAVHKEDKDVIDTTNLEWSPLDD
jgi:hypothetical protein